MTKETWITRKKRYGKTGSKNPKQLKNKMSERLKGNKYRKGKIPWNYIDGRSKTLGPARYGDDWDAIRRLILNRDNYTCQKCGISKKVLDIHHIIPFLETFDNSLNNLITLCRSCHMKEERLITKRR